MNSEPDFNFANILFGGNCNMRCPFCIGRQINPARTPDNLRKFPPRNFDRFLAQVRAYNIPEITFTGTTTDPQLYRHEAQLIRYLRRKLPLVRISLHTNGLLALRKMAVFNQYNRVTVSFSSFNPITHQKITGVRKMANLPEILRRATVPVKVSAIINQHTVGQMDAFLARCAAIGVRRVTLRRLFGDTRTWDILPGEMPVRYFRNNPVFNCKGMEVTVWNFQETNTRALNLFSDGSITNEYLIAEKQNANSFKN